MKNKRKRKSSPNTQNHNYECLETRRLLAAVVQNFDGLAAPNLPDGWAATNSGGLTSWETSTTQSWSGPNSAFVDNQSIAGQVELTTDEFTAPLSVSFRNRYNTELDWDGGVLEISFDDGGSWDDITGHGSFSSGGYNGVLNSNTFNPLSGRNAWTGDNGGFNITNFEFDNSVYGDDIRLRWVLGTDSSVGDVGWFIDDVTYTYVFAQVSSSIDFGALEGNQYDVTISTDIGTNPFGGRVEFLLGVSGLSSSEYQWGGLLSPGGTTLVSISPGESSVTTTLTLLDDSIVGEFEKSAQIFASDGVDVTTFETVAIYQFDNQSNVNFDKVDNDSSRVSISDATTNESGNLQFDVQLTNASDIDIPIEIGIEDISTVAADYDDSNPIVIVPAGSTSATFELPIIDDSLPELDEQLIARIIDIQADGRNISAGVSFDVHSYRVSPDGNLIAYIGDESEIIVAALDGSYEVTVFEPGSDDVFIEEFEFTPDQSKIAFVSSFEQAFDPLDPNQFERIWDVGTVPFNGQSTVTAGFGDVSLFGSYIDSPIHDLQVSPDSQWLGYFVTEQSGFGTTFEIANSNFISSQTFPVAPTFFEFTPDSQKVIYGSTEVNGYEDLYSAALDFSSNDLLTDFEPFTSSFFSTRAVTSDGQRLIYYSEAENGYLELYSVNIDGSSHVRLNEDINSSFLSGVGFWTFNSTETHIVYSADTTNPAPSLYSVPITGGNSTLLSAESAFNWQVTANDDVVFVADPDGDGFSDLFTIPVTGGISLQLNDALGANETVEGEQVKISPDGSTVVFSKGDVWITETVHLYSVPITGGPDTQLTVNSVSTYDNSQQNYYIHPDGDRVVFTNYVGGGFEQDLFIVPINGSTAPQLLATDLANDRSNIRISPDGERIMFFKENISGVLYSVSPETGQEYSVGAVASNFDFANYDGILESASPYLLFRDPATNILSVDPNAAAFATGTIIDDDTSGPILGDVNGDGVVNFLDIAPFITVLSSGGFQTEADIDQNGVVNFLDIAPYIALLNS